MSQWSWAGGKEEVPFPSPVGLWIVSVSEWKPL